MITIAICGDPHNRDSNPRKRIDNYSDECINKIKRILDRHKYLIFTGDFFDTATVSISYLNKLITELNPYRGRIHTILGNHDSHFRTLNLDKTALGLLDKIGIVKLHLDTFELAGVSFDVASVVPELKLPVKKSDILLGHFYLDNPFAPKESLRPEDLTDYRYVILGHDHKPYPPLNIKDTTILRQGSFMRTDVQDYNLTRDKIGYVVIREGVQELGLEYLDVSKPSEVFTSESFESKTDLDMGVDVERLDKLISSFRKQSFDDGMSTLNVLREIGCPEVNISYLRLIHESLGLYF